MNLVQHFHLRDSTHFAGPDEAELILEHQAGGAMRLNFLAKDAVPQVFERYVAVKISAQDLSQFAGEYSSAELQATYRISVKEGQLMLTVNWQEPLALEPTVRDEFHSPYGTAIVFHRDSTGHITSFDAFVGPVGPISFLKTSK